MAEGQPVWVRLAFSLVPLLMGLLILGAWFGIVPTDGGSFNAPPAVIFSLAGGLILFAFLVWIPSEAPKTLRVGLPAFLLLAVAVVCNWTAFAPGLHYTSEMAIGPWSSSGEDQVGGRIAFGLAALAVDALVVTGILTALRGWLRPK
jgi:hypothetical protein